MHKQFALMHWKKAVTLVCSAVHHCIPFSKPDLVLQTPQRLAVILVLLVVYSLSIETKCECVRVYRQRESIQRFLSCSLYTLSLVVYSRCILSTREYTTSKRESISLYTHTHTHTWCLLYIIYTYTHICTQTYIHTHMCTHIQVPHSRALCLSPHSSPALPASLCMHPIPQVLGDYLEGSTLEKERMKDRIKTPPPSKIAERAQP